MNSKQRRRAASHAAWIEQYPVPGWNESVPLTPGERAAARRCPSYVRGGATCGKHPAKGRRRVADGRVFLRCPVHTTWYSMEPEAAALLLPLAAFSWGQVMQLPGARKRAAVSA